ncbi:MAG: recombination mediator RecR [Opitutaceae bacterium]|jgi:recombination protein RecR|nr:recombination mediator RecR [Opitutaceae bacterium]
MTPAFEKLQQALKRLPGVGYRSAERMALHLLVEKPERLPALIEALGEAARAVRRCERCGNLAEGGLCTVCADERRDHSVVCVVEHVPDLVAMERSGAYRGVYHVLHGRLSPINGVGPDELNWDALVARLGSGVVKELILALGNDVEGEATCHFITKHLPAPAAADDPVQTTIHVSRIGFGLPSGGGVLYADAVTLRSALEGRRDYA